MKRLFVAAIVVLVTTVVPLLAQTFVPLPAVDGVVQAFAASGDTLYIAGNFKNVGASTRNGLAAINLADGTVTTWDPAATDGGSAASMTDVSVSTDGSKIYFAGSFDKVGATTRTFVAAVSPAGVLDAFAPTVNARPSAIRELNGTVYLVGEINTVNGSTRIGFAGIDSAGALTNFNPGLAAFGSANFRGVTFSADGTKMYVAMGNSGINDFTDPQGAAATRRGFVALQLSDGRATSFAMTPKDGPFDAGIFCVDVIGNILYAGDSFDAVQSTAIQRLAAFKNEVLDLGFSNETGTGPNEAVRSISTDGTSVYVAGGFTKVGTTDRTGLGAFDPTTGELISTWDPQLSKTLGGTNTVVFVHHGKVFIGGNDLAGGANLKGQAINYYGAVTAIPAPPAPPTPPAVAPTVKITGKAKITTTKSKLTIKGTAAGTVTSVGYKVGSKSGVASGTSSWSFPAKLKTGKNVITVTATGPGGTSAPAKVTVTKK